MKLGELIGVNEASFPIYPRLLRWLGINETVFLARIIWWQREDGEWIEKTTQQILEATGLSYKQQTSARDRLCKLGVLEQEYQRLKHQLRFRVNKTALEALEIPTGASAERLNGETPETLFIERSNLQEVPPPSAERLNGHKEVKDIGKTKEESTAASPTRQLTDGWLKLYLQKRGVEYGGFKLHGGREGNAVKSLLKVGSPEEILKTVKLAWSQTNSRTHFWCLQTKTLCQVASNWDKIIDELKESKTSKPVKDYSDHGDEFDPGWEKRQSAASSGNEDRF